MSKRAIVVLLVLTVVVGASALLHVYYISEGGDGTLYWNADTAYLFLNQGSRGYRANYLQFLGGNFTALLGGMPPTPSDKRFSSAVFTITSSNLRRYAIDDESFGTFEMANGNVYTRNLKTEELWKWDGNQFVPATTDDQGDLTSKLGDSGSVYDDVDGWHKRCCFFSHGEEYTYAINLKGANFSLISRREGLFDLSVDLVRPDGTRETIWRLDGNPRRVSRSEYQHTFAKH